MLFADPKLHCIVNGATVQFLLLLSSFTNLGNAGLGVCLMRSERHRSIALPIRACLAGAVLVLLQACVDGEIGWEADLPSLKVGSSREEIESRLGSPLDSRFFHTRGIAVYGYNKGARFGEASGYYALAPYLLPFEYYDQRGQILIIYGKNYALIGRSEYSDLRTDFAVAYDAATCNVGISQLTIGRVFELEVYEPDLAEAYFWYRLASANGAVDGGLRAERLAQGLTPEEIADAERLVAEWEPREDCNKIQAQ